MDLKKKKKNEQDKKVISKKLQKKLKFFYKGIWGRLLHKISIQICITISQGDQELQSFRQNYVSSTLAI